MEPETISPKQIIYILVIIAAVLGALYFFTRQKNEERNLSPAKEDSLSSEEKFRILEELNQESSTAAVISAEEKLEILHSLEKGSTTTISASDKIRLLQELQNKK